MTWHYVRGLKQAKRWSTLVCELTINHRWSEPRSCRFTRRCSLLSAAHAPVTWRWWWLGWQQQEIGWSRAKHDSDDDETRRVLIGCTWLCTEGATWRTTMEMKGLDEGRALVIGHLQGRWPSCSRCWTTGTRRVACTARAPWWCRYHVVTRTCAAARAGPAAHHPCAPPAAAARHATHKHDINPCQLARHQQRCTSELARVR